MKLNISKKLLGGFLLLISLIIIISIVSFVGLGAIEKNVKSIKFTSDYDDAITQIMVTMFKQQDSITDYSLTHSEKMLREFKDLSKIYDKQISKLLSIAPNEKEKTLLEVLANGHDEFEGLGVEMSKAFVSGNRVKGLTIMNDLDKIIQIQEMKIVELATIANDMAVNIEEEAHYTASNVKISMFIISLLGIIVGVGASFFIAISISEPVKKLARATERMADGDLTQTVNITQNDEIGEMADLFNAMCLIFKDVITKLKKASLEISMASEKTYAVGESLNVGVEMQEASIQNTSSSIEEMNISINEIANSTSNLTNRSNEASESIIEIVSSIGDIAVISEELSVTIDETSSSVMEMAASIAEISRHASQLSEYTSETVSTVAEIYHSGKEVENGILMSTKIAQANASEAEAGGEAVKMTINSMGNIQETVQTAASVIKSLGEKSISIGDILNVINSITEQTNLLALNAAIIAAQAGDEGKGFAVVAGQIKELANKTKSYTKEIEGIITPVQKDVENAIKLMEEGSINVTDGVERSKLAGEALDKIMNSAHSSVDIHKKIEVAASEQLVASKHASDAMEKNMTMLKKMHRAIEDQEKGSKYIAKASEEMNESARQVKDATKKQSYEGEHIRVVIEDMNKVINKIDKATNEQAKGSSHILYSVEEAKTITSENMLSVKEMKETAGALVDQVEIMEKIVKKFDV